MTDPITAALQAQFPEQEGTPPPVHDACGLRYERFNLAGHLRNDCPNPPFKDDVLAARAYREEWKP